jgi:predicted Fe-Mo cluster-binding NifX family protein
MKIAIPIFGARVSPRFDFAPRLLLYTLEDGRVVGREELSLDSWNAWERVERLKQMGVEALICGGIPGCSAQALEEYRIRVISWVSGDAEEALSCFLRGELSPGRNLCPGPRGMRHGLRKRFLPR